MPWVPGARPRRAANPIIPLPPEPAGHQYLGTTRLCMHKVVITTLMVPTKDLGELWAIHD